MTLLGIRKGVTLELKTGIDNYNIYMGICRLERGWGSGAGVRLSTTHSPPPSKNSNFLNFMDPSMMEKNKEVCKLSTLQSKYEYLKMTVNHLMGNNESFY